jgi:hypothetical protein
MTSFLHYFLGTIVFPRKAFRRLAADPRAVRQGFLAVLTAGVFLAGLSLLRGLLGGVPLAPVLAGGPPYNYFAWQTLFALPLLFAIWMLSAAVLRLFAGGRAAGRAISAAAGFALALPCLLAAVPLWGLAVLMLLGMPQAEGVAILSSPGAWQTAFLAVHGLAALWAWFLAAQAASAGRKAPWGRAALAGLAAAAVEVAMFVVFVR